MADVDWTEVTSSLEKTEVVLKGLSADVQPSTDPDEAATHVAVNGIETQTEEEEATESVPQQAEMEDSEPTVEGVALESDCKDEPQELQGEVGDKDEPGERYSLLQPDDVVVEGRASEGGEARQQQKLQGEVGDKDEPGERYSLLQPDDVVVEGRASEGGEARLQQKLQGEVGDKDEPGERYSLLQPDDVGVEGRASEGREARQQQSERSKVDTKKDEVEEKRYSVLTNDDVDIQGVGLQSQLPETNVAADVTTSLEETEKEQQGGEDGEVGNTKRISILSPEDPSVEGVAVESEVQEDERKPEPPQPDETKETSEEIREGLDETQVESVVMEGDIPQTQMPPESPLEVLEGAITVEPSGEGTGDERPETDVQLTNEMLVSSAVEVTANETATEQETEAEAGETVSVTRKEEICVFSTSITEEVTDKIEDGVEEKATVRVNVGADAEKRHREQSITDEPPPEKRAKEEEHENQDQREPIDEAMEVTKKPDCQLDKILANVTEIEFEESPPEQISSATNIESDESELVMVPEVKQNSEKTPEDEGSNGEVVEEYFETIKQSDKGISQYIATIRSDDAVATDSSSKEEIPRYGTQEEESIKGNIVDNISYQETDQENRSLENITPQQAPIEECVQTAKRPEQRLSQYIQKIEADDQMEEHDVPPENIPTEGHLEEHIAVSVEPMQLSAPQENSEKEKIKAKPANDPVEEYFETVTKPEQRLSQYLHSIEAEDYRFTNPSISDVSDDVTREKLVAEEVPVDESPPAVVPLKESSTENRDIVEDFVETTVKPEQRISRYLMAAEEEITASTVDEEHTEEVTTTVVASSLVEISPKVSRPETTTEQEAVEPANKDEESVEEILAVIDTLPEDDPSTEPEDVAPYTKDRTPQSNLQRREQSFEEAVIVTNQPEKSIDESLTTKEIAFEETAPDERATKSLDDIELEPDDYVSSLVKKDREESTDREIVEESLESESKPEHKVGDIVQFLKGITHEEAAEEAEHHIQTTTIQMEHFDEETKETQKILEQKKTVVKSEHEKLTENTVVLSTTTTTLTSISQKQDIENPSEETTVPELLDQTSEVEQSQNENENITVVAQTNQEESAIVSLSNAEKAEAEVQPETDKPEEIAAAPDTEAQPEGDEPVRVTTNITTEMSIKLRFDEPEEEAILPRATGQPENEKQKESTIASELDVKKPEKQATPSEAEGDWQEELKIASALDVNKPEETTSSQMQDKPEGDKQGEPTATSNLEIDKPEEETTSPEMQDKPEDYKQEEPMATCDLNVIKPEEETASSPIQDKPEDNKQEEPTVASEVEVKSPKEEMQENTNEETDDVIVVAQARREESTTVTTTTTVEPSTVVTTPESTAATTTIVEPSTVVTTPESTAVIMTPSETTTTTVVISPKVKTTTTTKTVVLHKSNQQVKGKSKNKMTSPEIRLTSATPIPAELEQIREEEHAGVAPLASREEDNLDDDAKLIEEELKNKSPEEKKPEVESKKAKQEPEAKKPEGAATSDDSEPLVKKKSHKNKCCAIL